MDPTKEQRVCIKFCANLGKSAAETQAMIRQAFGEESMIRTRVFEWHARFRAGQTSIEPIEDDEHTCGRINSTTPETVAKLQQLVREDRSRTIQELADEIGIGYGICQRIMTVELGMHRVAAKFVPRILTADQKQQRVNVCEELRQTASDDATFLSRVITGGESWIYGYDPKTKQQSSQCKMRSEVKSMLIIFYDIKGIVHKEFVLAGQTVNSVFYCDVLQRLHENMQRLRPELCRQKNWLLHHDNAPSHTSFFTREFLTKNNMTVVPHPPYSPDLAPCDFSLFPLLKRKLKGRHFDTIEVMETESQAVLNTLAEQIFQDAFKNWQKRWEWCICEEGDYFEVDGGQWAQR
jgi:transposase